MSVLRKVELENTTQLDAFHRLRVSSPQMTFGWPGTRNTFPSKLWRSSTSGAGTGAADPDKGRFSLSVPTSGGGGATGDTAIYESIESVPYQAGLSTQVKISFSFGGLNSGVQKDVGLFDAENGIFLRQGTGGGYSFIMRTNTSGTPADTSVAQASWNIDPMNGSGPSGITLNWNFSKILVIDLQYLGVGTLRVGFDIDGEFVPVHRYDHGEALYSLPYWSRGSLPVRFSIYTATPPAATAYMHFICASVISEGGLDVLGYPYSVANGTTTIAVTTRRAVLSIRPKTTLNSALVRGIIVPKSLALYTDGNIYWELVMWHTLGGSPSYTSVNADSIVEYDVAGTTITGSPLVLASGYLTSGGGSAVNAIDVPLNNTWPLGNDVSGASPLTQLSVVATSLSGTANTAAALTWLEQQ